MGFLRKSSRKGAKLRRQVAALCHRERGGKRQVLLITSRERKRWIVPKGWPIDGLDDSESAAQEAWEEAGVKSAGIDAEPLGAFDYEKRVAGGENFPVRAEVFGIEVQNLEADYPEADERRREWVAPNEAADRVEEPELKRILRTFGED